MSLSDDNAAHYASSGTLQASEWSFGSLPVAASPRAEPIVSRRQTTLDDDGQARSLEMLGVVLQILRETTGLRFAAVARVTSSDWLACAVSSSVATALRADQPVPVETTLCDQVRESGRPLARDRLAPHGNEPPLQPPPDTGPLTALRGFQCYIGVPILLSGGEFFGTLCAMDTVPTPASIPATIALMESLAQMIRLQLDAEDRLRESHAALRSGQNAGAI